jgi:hypothetical protein
MQKYGNRALMLTVSFAARHPREGGDSVHGFLNRLKTKRFAQQM